MKKISLFSVVLMAIAVAAVSCVSPLDNPLPLRNGQTVLRITPVVAGALTKAEPEAGDDTYNENRITDYYWYVFSDAAGTVCKVHGHETGDVAKEITLDRYFPDGGTGYVYVVANLPEEPSATTYAGLQKVSFGKSMPTTYTASSEFYEYTSATTGVPKPEKFVMRTENLVPFTLAEKTVVPVTAELKRVAAKIILELNVAKRVDQTKTQPSGAEQYVKTWLSDIEHLQVYMLWGSTHGNLAGTPYHYGDTGVQDSWFYSASPRYAMYTNPVGGRFNGDDVDGSVPSSRYSTVDLSIATTVWEIVYKVHEDSDGNPIWIWGSDVPASDRTDENIGDKNYGDWDYVLVDGQKQPVYNADGTVQRQLATVTETKPYWKINSLPLYSMPITWSVNDAHAPFIKVILPWKGYDKNTQQPSQAVAKEFFYKILIPERSTLDANGCYRISLDLSVLGSEADEVPVELSGKYHVVDWGASEEMGGDQIVGRYLNCASHFEFYSQNEMAIPVQSSHDIEVVSTGTYAPLAAYKDYSSSSIISTKYLDRSATFTWGNYYKLTTSDNSGVKVVHQFETDLKALKPYDVSPITYTFRIQHADNPSFYKDITVVQYPSLYITNDRSNGYVCVNGYNSSRWDVSAWDNRGTYSNYYIDGTPTGEVLRRFLGNVWRYGDFIDGGGSNNNPNQYNISVSVLGNLPESLADAYIADPRETVGSGLTYIDSGLDNYKKTRADASWAIAPIYKVASSYGMCFNASLLYENAVKRCATYQENGYPAGRWRLPTKAEILYAVNLSDHKCIPSLFDGTYWTSSGECYDSGSGEWITPSSTGTYPVRCVYDVWFWGDDKDTAHMTSWGGFQD